MTESTLDKLIDVFVPKNDFYFFDDDKISNACLRQGITIYTREEFASSFPFFALEYGSLYHIWTMKRPKDSYVLVTTPAEFASLPEEIQRRLFLTQIHYGRGHIYPMDWLEQFKIEISNTTTVDGKSYYFLTWDDWSALTSETRKEWLLKWLREWRKEENTELIQFTHDHEGVPYNLIQQYAGTFADTSTANCFAAAIAMVVGTRNQIQSQVLISQWLHQGPFFGFCMDKGT